MKNWSILSYKIYHSTVAAAVGVKTYISKDKATLNSEEIKSLALAVLELCLSEGISK